MLIGKLRHRVTIQAATVSQDSYGEPIETWANLGTNPTVWADVQWVAGGERFISGGEQVQSTLAPKVRMRYRTDVTVKMRCVYGSRYLYIENVIDPTGKGAFLDLMCREVQF